MKAEEVTNMAALMGASRVDVSRVRDELDKLTTLQVVASLPEGRHVFEYAEGSGHWKVGDGRPMLADDDPAVMCAIGRCASARVRWGDRPPQLGMIHGQSCGWCEYDLSGLLTALDWFTWHGRMVTREVWSWTSNGFTYTRAKGGSGYQEPRVAAFAALPPSEQTIRVNRAVAGIRS